MAKGIESYAHISCIKNGGYTLAFLGCGVDVCYPSEHKELMDAIILNGAVISEYLPGTSPRAEYFPKRNRLISSWSRKILVVEAAEKSGALITANIALSQGKDVYAPPHEIGSITGKGTNKLLIKDAKMYLEPSQLLFETILLEDNNASNIDDILHKKTQVIHTSTTTINNLSPIEEKILESIHDAEKSVEKISFETQIDQVQLMEYLFEMELEGKVFALAGGKYRKSASHVT